VEIRCGGFAGQSHLATVSEAHETEAEAVAEREAFEAWRHTRQGVLKSAEDWASWCEFRAAMLARKRSGARLKVTQGGGLDVLKRQFLRALVRGMWGVGMGVMTYQEVGVWLTSAGFKTSLNEVKNAKRKGNEPVAGAVGASPSVVPLLQAIIAAFPAVAWDNFFPPEDRETVAAWLAEGGTR
jgi:hypothetical protein